MTDFIMLKNVRVNFPHLFTRPVINGEEGKFGVMLMIDPESQRDQLDAAHAAMGDIEKAKWQGKVKVPDHKKCLRDGDAEARSEYDGHWVLSANTDKKPIVIDASGAGTCTEADACPIYGGCYVNAKVSLWAQDNKYGKRVNAQLVAIQFVADGEPLDGTHVSIEDAMDGFGATAGADSFLDR